MWKATLAILLALQTVVPVFSFVLEPKRSIALQQTTTCAAASAADASLSEEDAEDLAKAQKVFALRNQTIVVKYGGNAMTSEGK
jgi:hypothetical protein